MTPHLQIKGLTKTFGKVNALNGADMEIPRGHITGLLGPNASGKTTLLKIVAGLLQPTAGSVCYPDGASPGPRARKTVGFCPDGLRFPRWMRVRDAFSFYRDMYPDYSQERADRLAELLELNTFMGTRTHRLSKGMKERLILGLTFSRETDFYLLDEPLDGIDPVGKTKIIDAILTLKPENASVLVSTHLVKDIERIFDGVFFLSKGKIIFSGSCDAMREEHDKTVEQVYLEVFSSEAFS